MNDKAGKLGAGFIWLFAFAAIVLGVGGGMATSGLGVKVSSAVFLGVFAIAGFLGAYLTRAGTGAAVGAFVFAAVAVAGGYYFAVVKATSAIAATAGSSEAAAVGSSMGNAIGTFIAIVVFLEALFAGIGGVMAGSKAKASLATA